MTWQGENNITKYFGLRGFKCLLITLMDEINELRQTAGLPPRNFMQFLSKMDFLMEQYKIDDEGAEPV